MKPADPAKRVAPSQVAPMFGVVTPTVVRWCRSGKLPALRLPSGYYRILPADAERLRRSCESVRRVRKRPDAAQIAARDEAAIREINSMH